MHATAETAVDELLRTDRMVDFYRVVRESVRVGEPGYSIKNLERFYMPARTTAVASGGDSLVIYDRFRETGDNSLLNDLRDYNRDDCLSTLLLRDWLIGCAKEAGRWPPAPHDASVGGSKPEDDRQEEREERERAQAALEAALVADPKAPDAEARQLMADLVGFHRREAKPAWWAFFDRQKRSAEEIQDDDECLGGCVADGEDWIGRDKRSLTFRYRYPEQETKLQAREVRDILMNLLAQRVIGRDGLERQMTLDDVLVVAPYNMQVNLLRSILPDGARVGTVDRFQGQEAEAVIISMTTSGADDMPRDASFLLSRNRLNVAISRARCLAVLVASPGLLDLVANSVDEMKLANLFCWAAEFARGSTAAFPL